MASVQTFSFNVIALNSSLCFFSSISTSLVFGVWSLLAQCFPSAIWHKQLLSFHPLSFLLFLSSLSPRHFPFSRPFLSSSLVSGSTRAFLIRLTSPLHSGGVFPLPEIQRARESEGKHGQLEGKNYETPRSRREVRGEARERGRWVKMWTRE